MSEADPTVASRCWLRRLRDSKTASLLGRTGFRRLYLGGTASRVGDKLYFVAAMWLVYELTGSTVFTGVAGFLTRAPQVLSVFLGPLVDRAKLRRLLALSELGQGVVVLAVPVAAATGHLSVWVVLAAMPLLAFGKRLTAPAEQAAFVRLVDDDLLARGNSLWTGTERSVAAAAEAAAGVLVGVVGAVALFVVNGVTFLVSAVLFGSLSVPATEASDTALSLERYVADLRSGIALIRDSVLGHVVVAATLAGAFTGMGTAVLPAFAGDVGGAQAFGLLVAATTVGTLVGTLLAPRLETVALGRLTVVGFGGATLARLGAVVADRAWLVVGLFGATAVPLGVYNVLTSTAVQTGVPDDRLARVSSTLGTITAVLGPLGFLAGGALGTVVGADAVVAASAFGFLVLAAYWVSVPSLRRFPAVTGLDADAFAA